MTRSVQLKNALRCLTLRNQNEDREIRDEFEIKTIEQDLRNQTRGGSEGRQKQEKKIVVGTEKKRKSKLEDREPNSLVGETEDRGTLGRFRGTCPETGVSLSCQIIRF